MIVQKYGGTSLETIEKMQAVAKRIQATKAVHEDVIVVVSAMGKTTNQLIELALQASKNPAKRELDMLLSTGEQVSTSLLSMMLNDLGLEAVSLNGLQAGILTEGLFTKNKIKDIDTKKIQAHLSLGKVVVITGFQGYNPHGDITTLGRGGSDTSAVAISAKFGCACEIYTDVDGIYTMDPRRFAHAKMLSTIGYEEMSELAYLGATVMEVRAVEIAQKFNVPVRVSNAHKDCAGTWIKEHNPMIEHHALTGLSVTEDIVMISLHHIKNATTSVSELFALLAEAEVNVDMISQTPLEDDIISLAFTAPKEDIVTIRDVLETFKTKSTIGTVKEDDTLSKVSLVGIGMRSQSGFAAKIFTLFKTHAIAFKQVTTSDISISYTIPKTEATRAASVIADAFNL